MIIPILWLEKLRNEFIKWFAQGQLVNQEAESADKFLHHSSALGPKHLPHSLV